MRNIMKLAEILSKKFISLGLPGHIHITAIIIIFRKVPTNFLCSQNMMELLLLLKSYLIEFREQRAID